MTITISWTEHELTIVCTHVFHLGLLRIARVSALIYALIVISQSDNGITIPYFTNLVDEHIAHLTQHR